MLPQYRAETVLDREVALAAKAQGLAPAVPASAQIPRLPPLLKTVGVPSHAARASPLLKEMPPTPAADAFAKAETARRVKQGGFVGVDSGSAIFAIPEQPMAYLGDDKWTVQKAQVPQDMVRGSAVIAAVTKLAPAEQKSSNGGLTRGRA